MYQSSKISVFLLLHMISASPISLLEDAYKVMQKFMQNHDELFNLMDMESNTFNKSIVAITSENSDKSEEELFRAAYLKVNESPEFQHLVSYGCYCNFDTRQRGHGKNVDYVDGTCHQLWDNYLCIKLSAEERGEICEPKEDEYDSYMIFMNIGAASVFKQLGYLQRAESLLNQAYDACVIRNPDSICMQDTCKAEVRWTYDLLFEGLIEKGDADDFETGNVNNFYDEQYVNYNQQELCIREGRGQQNVPKSCCGESPSCRLYSTRNKGCCGNTIYNTIEAVCDDDQVVPVFL